MKAASCNVCVSIGSICESPPSSTNSSVAPRSAAAFSASAVRCAGVPLVPASPREPTTKCAECPACVSRAITPPQPNSTSSGCAPKASNSRLSGGDFSVGFIGAVDRIAVHKHNVRRIGLVQVGLFPRAADVVRAMHDRLHPAQACVARRAHLLLGKIGRRQREVAVAALVQLQCTVKPARADNLAGGG